MFGVGDQRVDMQFLVAALRFVRGNAEKDLGGGPPQTLVMGLVQIEGHAAHIFATITVTGEHQAFAAFLEIAQPDAGGEDVHLPARVVHIVFAMDLATDGGQQIGDNGPVGRAPAMPDMQGAGRIGRDEFHLDPLPGAAWPLPNS